MRKFLTSRRYFDPYTVVADRIARALKWLGAIQAVAFYKRIALTRFCELVFIIKLDLTKFLVRY